MSVINLPLIFFLWLKEWRTPRLPRVLRHPVLHGLLETLAMAVWFGLFLWAVRRLKSSIKGNILQTCRKKGKCEHAWPLVLMPVLMAYVKKISGAYWY